MGKLTALRSNLWSKIGKPAMTAGKYGAVAAPAVVGLGYGGLELADWNHRRNEQGVVDETGIKGDRLSTGDVTYKDALADVLPYDKTTGLGRTDARRGMPATFGPSPSGNSYGRLLNTQIEAFGADNEGFTKDGKPASENDIAAWMTANQSSPIPVTAVKTIDSKPHILMNDAQRAEYTKSNTLDASGMDGDLEALKARYGQREASQNQQIKDIEDRPYQVDLSPVMALWKSWYGSDFGNYKRPETVDARMQRVYAMRDKMQQEATQRDESLFNAKSSLEGRKLQLAQWNEGQRVAGMERGVGLDEKQITIGHNDAAQKIQQAQFGANHKLAQLTLNNTINHQNQQNKIDMIKAMRERDEKAKMPTYFGDGMKKSIIEEVKKYTNGNVAWAQAILAAADKTAADNKMKDPSISDSEAMRAGFLEAKRVIPDPDKAVQKP